MSDKSTGFLEVANRLRLALDLKSENQLAAALGFKQSSWSTRKTRNSLPTDEIDALLAREGISAEFIYHGLGPVHVDDDDLSWQAGFDKRLQQALGLKTYQQVLISQGHKAADIKAVLAGKAQPTPRMLRDIYVHLKTDVRWLLTGEVPEGPRTPQETAVLAAHRSTDAVGRAAIEHVGAAVKDRSKK